MITSLCVLHSLGRLEMFMELYRKEEEVARRIKGGNEKERDKFSQ